MNVNNIDFDALGVTGIIAVLFVVLVNIAKAKKIPITIPGQWRALVAGVGAAGTTAAVLHLTGANLKTSLLSALVATFLPGGIHGVFAQPEADTPAKPTTVENAQELGAAVAAALPETVRNVSVVVPAGASPDVASAVTTAAISTPPPKSTTATGDHEGTSG